MSPPDPPDSAVDRAFCVSGRCDIEALLAGLIWLLIYALVICLVCYVVTRIASQIVPGFAPYAWIVWAIGGLIWLILALRLLGPLLP